MLLNWAELSLKWRWNQPSSRHNSCWRRWSSPSSTCKTLFWGSSLQQPPSNPMTQGNVSQLAYLKRLEIPECAISKEKEWERRKTRPLVHQAQFNSVPPSLCSSCTNAAKFLLLSSSCWFYRHVAAVDNPRRVASLIYNHWISLASWNGARYEASGKPCWEAPRQ